MSFQIENAKTGKVVFATLSAASADKAYRELKAKGMHIIMYGTPVQKEA